mgnify:CR=1 FL=1|jgi:hypothetical protein
MKTALGLLILSITATAQVRTRATIYLAPMDGSFEGFIAAEIVKQRLPLVVVNSEAGADFIMSGAAVAADAKWFYSKDHTEGNIRVYDARSHRLVWADEAGDRSLMPFAGWRRGNRRKVAERIVSKLAANGLVASTEARTATERGYHLER